MKICSILLVSAAWAVALVAGLLLASAAAATGSVLPPDEASSPKALASSPRHGEWVRISDSSTAAFDAWIVYPERSTKAPVLILVHEIFGLSDWARAVADQYAAEGFIVIAPDFLSGHAPDGVGGTAALGAAGVGPAIAKLDPKEITSRLNAAAGYGTALPSATKSYGVVGYCWGGGISFGWATAQPGLKASVVFYGTPPRAEALANIKAPVLGLYGGSDARITSTVTSTQDEMKKLGKRYEAEIYEGAGHGFLRNQAGQNGANFLAVQKSWPRSVAFLKQTLEVAGTASAGSASVAVVDNLILCPIDCDNVSVALN